MKLRAMLMLAADCSSLTLVLGMSPAVATGPDTDLDTAGGLETQPPDGDGGNPGLAEPAGVGAPEGLTAVGEWTITTTDVQGRTVRFGELPTGTADQSPAAAAAAGSWWDGQCGSDSSTTNKFDVLKQYNRPKVHKRMEGSKSKMYCGKSVSTQSEAAFGLRHIRARHEGQFADLAALEGRDWGNFMHWSVSWVISEPGWRTVQNANRYCYQKRFGFRSPNGSTFDREVVVILGRTGVRIMTALPSTNHDYCQGTRI